MENSTRARSLACIHTYVVCTVVCARIDAAPAANSHGISFKSFEFSWIASSPQAPHPPKLYPLQALHLPSPLWCAAARPRRRRRRHGVLVLAAVVCSSSTPWCAGPRRRGGARPRRCGVCSSSTAWCVLAAVVCSSSTPWCARPRRRGVCQEQLPLGTWQVILTSHSRSLVMTQHGPLH